MAQWGAPTAWEGGENDGRRDEITGRAGRSGGAGAGDVCVVGRGAGGVLVAELLPEPYVSHPEPVGADGGGGGRRCRSAGDGGDPPRHHEAVRWQYPHRSGWEEGAG